MPDQLVERGVHSRRVRSLDERRLSEHTQSNDGLRPCRGIVRAAPGHLPEDRASRSRLLSRERAVNAYESVGNELFDLCRREPARR